MRFCCEAPEMFVDYKTRLFIHRGVSRSLLNLLPGELFLYYWLLLCSNLLRWVCRLKQRCPGHSEHNAWVRAVAPPAPRAGPQSWGSSSGRGWQRGRSEGCCDRARRSHTTHCPAQPDTGRCCLGVRLKTVRDTWGENHFRLKSRVSDAISFQERPTFLIVL